MGGKIKYITIVKKAELTPEKNFFIFRFPETYYTQIRLIAQVRQKSGCFEVLRRPKTPRFLPDLSNDANFTQSVYNQGMDELALVQLAQKGDLDAFNRLVLAYQDQAFNLACRMLTDDDAAEDATQMAFLSAYRSLSSYRGGSFRAWVLRMVTNACYDELRRRQRRPTTPLEPLDPEGEEEVESPAWMADDGPSPEQELEQGELDAAVQHCLNDLPEDFRAVVVMVDIEGLDYQEVAEIAGKPLGTIKSRLARARMKLRECLQQFWELLPSKFRLDGEEK
jgi:RNA polymerase sigma-70 factor (ECF subfamily)